MSLLDHLPHLFFSITSVFLLRHLEYGKQDVSFLISMSRSFFKYIEHEKDYVKGLSLDDYHQFREDHFRAFKERISSTRKLTGFLNIIFTLYFMIFSFLLFDIDSLGAIALVVVYTSGWKTSQSQMNFSKAVGKTEQMYIHRAEAYLKVYQKLVTEQFEPAQREWVYKKMDQMDSNIMKSIDLLKTYHIRSIYHYALAGCLGYLLIKHIGGF